LVGFTAHTKQFRSYGAKTGKIRFLTNMSVITNCLLLYKLKANPGVKTTSTLLELRDA
jgi:hypothetical protein